MQNFTMVVSKKEGGEYVKVGEVAIFYPLLSEMGLAVEPKETDKEGFPVYEDSKVQYVFDAVLAAVKAQARNKLVSGTATLKPGLTIAETVEQLLESGGRSGEALANRREFLAAFKAWVPTLGKSKGFSDQLISLASNAEALAVIEAAKREKFSGYLISFAETLNSEQAAKFGATMTKLNEACTQDSESDWE